MNMSFTAMMNTLSTRLSLALIAIVAAVGFGVFFSSQIGMQNYYEELNQKLNASVAMYVTGEYQLLQQEGETLNRDALTSLAKTAMIINPAVEVYVLDAQGLVIGHNFPEESILHQRVPLGPVRAFIEGDMQFPFRNIDPRLLEEEKVFSASEIRHNDVLLGYLYVVLGGEIYDNIEGGLSDSYSLGLLKFSIVAIVIAALVAGLLVFHLLVRRLRTLSVRMQKFSEKELNLFGLQESSSEAGKTGDEIDILCSTFEGLTKKVAEQFEALHEADEVKRELISNVSHDLRTPLSSIQGYLETLLIKGDRLSESERLKYLQTAMKSSRRLGMLIGDLFELSKLDANQGKLNLESFSLSELVYDTVQEFELEFSKRGIAVEIRDAQNQVLVYADISLMQRVFENLLRNAMAYTPVDGKVTLVIDAAENNGNASLQITVSDTGKGINPEDLPYIFDRFYSSAEHGRDDVISTGLGLAIVKRILELHGTTISVNSQLNQGTSFEFSLLEKAA